MSRFGCPKHIVEDEKENDKEEKEDDELINEFMIFIKQNDKVKIKFKTKLTNSGWLLVGEKRLR